MAWNEPGKGKDSWRGENSDRGRKSSGPPDLDQIWKRFRARFSGGSVGSNNHNNGKGGGGLPTGIFIGLIAFVIACWLLLGGLYIVQPGEKGVVLRFGAYQKTAAPGWHWHLPYPLAWVYKVDTQQVRQVGNEAVMLTKDENLVDMQISAQYRVSNARDFLFKVQNPAETVQEVLRSAVRDVVGASIIIFL